MPEEKVGWQLDLNEEVCPYPAAKTSGIPKIMLTVQMLEVTIECYVAEQKISNLMEKQGDLCELVP